MSIMPNVAVVGTCDTKLEALTFIKETICASGKCNAILIDIGSYDPSNSSQIDITRHELLKPTLHDVDDRSSRISALEVMTTALTETLSRLYAQRAIDGVIGAGGSGNTSVCAKAFRDVFPIGFPKLVVSTMASGNTAHYVGETDITMMYSVADVAGMNPILESVLRNAAHAIAGMAVDSYARRSHTSSSAPAIAITMFGLTTPCVQMATEKLEDLGYSVVVFHANGAGGMSMERLIWENNFVGVLDITTTELADELVGGVLTAGPNRLTAAAKAGIPQVVSVGALDMVNFGPASSVPEEFSGRCFNHHNASITLMRTTRDECAKLGEIIADKLSVASPEKTRVVLPLRGFSGIDVEGGPFRDEEADIALLDALRSGRIGCPVMEVDANINDPSFALAAVTALEEMLESR
ncbi:hypothetical protein SERLA73DRAFT_186726 [Serpula lacrymans var. lacrymans S7.3]|uniref:Uncharacterized protein n=2 Tax=Serpula lacrymans var. lacrymans TaxID=341189 RepID=F8Q7T3_SERL3|nr:uncharacterized protein SERLADRAFT_475931 [Serpula lacrymans var. lacrymans S7.9]EGN95621.1 hypothetical protein SERLA73DRAFT_186726 [Serpula lacrymans var. lacrymans S7.3]EGO21148.1 hypothetical protein SERLADRAFT_475931 [Serpula lacrymans var. lacrymans S7.9]